MEKYINDMDHTEKEFATAHITRIEDNLLKVYLDCAERTTRALFMLNAGGTGTLLAYIYNTGTNSSWIKSALGVFILGLILAFILVAFDYFFLLGRVQDFHNKITDFYSNKISFNILNTRLTESDGKSLIYVGILSGLCALTGIILSVIGCFITKL